MLIVLVKLLRFEIAERKIYKYHFIFYLPVSGCFISLVMVIY